ncbi:MAG TPA: MDR family MFS transporter [Stellaceae bacterium]|nr:MDR family MFS transporter [Stellaceae bacterium]
MSDPAAESLPHPSIRRRPIILAAVMMGMFMAAVESTIVATAMPTIVAELGGFREFSWVFAIFPLTQAISTPIYGRLADLYGRKPMFCAGALIFLLGSTLCGFAWDMGALIAFRAIQGLGAGAIIPVATTIIADLYTPTDRARVQGWLGSVWGFSAVVGPLLGAFIVEHVSWSVVFWVNLPIGAIAIGMIAGFLHERLVPRRHSIDYAGAALLAIGSGALMLVLTQAHEIGSTALWLLLLVAAAGIGAAIRQERIAPEPMLRLDLWRHRIIAVGNVGAVSIGAVMMGITAFLPTYVQGAMGRSPVVAGFALTAMSIGWSAVSPLAGRIMIHGSYRMAALLGGAAFVVGGIVLSLMRPDSGPLWAGLGAIFIGIGMGFCNTTFLVSIQSSVGWSERGTATSSMLFMRMVGQSIGVAVFGGVFNYALFGSGAESAETINRLMDPMLRQSMEPAVVARLAGEIGEALHSVYLIALALAVLTVLLSTLLPAGHGATASKVGD